MDTTVTPYDALGHFQTDWLNSRHHFSFGHYHDPARMGVGPLRVWNDDEVRPGTGFEPHPHRNMEIITYVRRGAITHRDSLGNEGRTVAGDVQVMSAGTGIVHAEYNLEAEPTAFFQIWIEPDRAGHPPRWATKRFPAPERSGVLVPLASGEAGHDEALPIHRDATLYGATLPAGGEIEHVLLPGRLAYLVPSRGDMRVNGTPVPARAGAAFRTDGPMEIVAKTDSEFLLADLPAGG
jgi:redox-sensitive bicupin YhaK (pirin superfamily)